MSPSGGIFDIAGKRSRLSELEPVLNDPDLWNDPDNARRISQESARLRRVVDGYSRQSDDLEGLEELFELAEDEEDAADLAQEAERLDNDLDELPRDPAVRDRIVGHSHHQTRSGGTESSDWSGMLLRMYRRFAERNGFRVEFVDVESNEAAPQAIDYAQFIIRGERAFGFMAAEGGVHRLVRVSPFDSQGRRHTSFSSVEVMPEIDDDINIEIDPNDLRIVYRSSGPGVSRSIRPTRQFRLVWRPGTPAR